MASATTDPVIEIRDLEFRWRPQGPAVLQVADFTVRRGERVFLQGASGSGKSTLLAVLAGVTAPQQGRVVVLGRALDTLGGIQRDAFRADHIGFIFQLFNLLPYLSVLENVVLPCRFSARRRQRALQRSGSVDNEARRLLAHLDLADPALLARPATDLSVGQQQRVAAARALIGDPEIVMADEPTSALDTGRRETFLRLLINECNELGTTLLFVSHDASSAHLFDRRVELDTINRAQLVQA